MDQCCYQFHNTGLSDLILLRYYMTQIQKCVRYKVVRLNGIVINKITDMAVDFRKKGHSDLIFVRLLSGVQVDICI